jgi:hypothetical protein
MTKDRLHLQEIPLDREGWGSPLGKCMVACWQTCTWPKEIGGLGITDLRLAGTAFEAKWLWL